jgi:carbonic anhydrase
MNKSKSTTSESKTHLIQSASAGELHAMLISGVSTGVAVVACSEMDVCRNLPPDPKLPILIWQNLGGSVDDSGGLAEVLIDSNISDVVIFGHYPCEIVELGLRGDVVEDPLLSPGHDHFMGLMTATRQKMRAKYGDRFDREVMMKGTQDFVLRQAEAMFELAEFNLELADRNLRVHAWLELPEIGDVWQYDSKCHSFCTRLIA